MALQRIEDLAVGRIGHITDSNPSEAINPPHGELAFRFIDELSGGSVGLVFENIKGQEITISPAEYDTFKNKSYNIKRILPATDCNFTVSY